jgi:hypothetical protein
MTNPYSMLRILFIPAAASTNYHLEKPSTPENSQPAPSARSGGSKPSFTGLRGSMPARRKVRASHDPLVSMKSQLG